MAGLVVACRAFGPRDLLVKGHASFGYGLTESFGVGATLGHIRREGVRSMIAERRYLLLPVKNGAPKHWVRVSYGGREIDDFEIEAADAEPDWWAFLDVSGYRGRTIDIEADGLSRSSGWLGALRQSDEIPGAEPMYREALRPQFHFTTRRGWVNDPNGLVFDNGKYHLFYQHNPYGVGWGNMHWGHAVSADLVHWHEAPDALYPDDLGTMFSGSAVVDRLNTSGLATGPTPPIALIYTAAGDTSRASHGKPSVQCLAVSGDGGETWTKYPDNPILDALANGNRDPKVVWHAPTKHWVMALYLQGDDFALLRSADLKHWERTGDVKIPGDAECPNFFEIPFLGRRRESKWVIFGASGRYRVGSFDGETFTPETDPIPLNHGDSYYAAQVFTDLPRNRRVLVPWARQDLPNMPFNQKMGFPVDLTLHQTPAGPRLFAAPIREISKLVERSSSLRPGPLAPGEDFVLSERGELLDIDLELRVGAGSRVVAKVRGVPIAFDAADGRLTCGASSAIVTPGNGMVRLRVLFDRTSVELFANAGEVYMPTASTPTVGDERVAVRCERGEAAVVSGAVRVLRSSWGQEAVTTPSRREMHPPATSSR